jgi:hypothetical protein
MNEHTDQRLQQERDEDEDCTHDRTADGDPLIDRGSAGSAVIKNEREK